MTTLPISSGRWALVFIVASCVFVSGNADAAVLRSGDIVSVSESAEIQGDFYAAGNDVHVSGSVDGDLYVLGGTVTLNGPVNGDVVIAGGTVSIHGTVGDDVRILGGKVTIASAVADDVLIAGGSLTVLSTAKVEGDVLFYGGKAEIAGEVKGAVHTRSESLLINSSVGSVDATLERDFVIGSEARIQGDVNYVSTSEVARSPNSSVGGKVHRKDAAAPAQGPIEEHATVWFTVLFSALVAVLLFKNFISNLFITQAPRVGFCGFLGLGVLLFTPIACGLLMVSVLGALAGVFLLLAYLTTLAAALVLTHVFVGAFIAKALTKEYKVNWLFTALGVVVTQGALMIPILGPLIIFATFATVTGMLVYHAYVTFYA